MRPPISRLGHRLRASGPLLTSLVGGQEGTECRGEPLGASRPLLSGHSCSPAPGPPRVPLSSLVVSSSPATNMDKSTISAFNTHAIVMAHGLARYLILGLQIFRKQ